MKIRSIFLALIIMITSGQAAHKSEWIYCCASIIGDKLIYVDVANARFISMIDDSVSEVEIWVRYDDFNSEGDICTVYSLMRFRSSVHGEFIYYSMPKVICAYGDDKLKPMKSSPIWKQVPRQSVHGLIMKIALEHLRYD